MENESSGDKVIVYAIDLDGTLMDKGQPIQRNINKCNELYEQKDTMVIIHTSRNETIRQRTEEYLKMNGIHYHLLVMNKLRADYYIDDRNLTMEKFLNER